MLKVEAWSTVKQDSYLRISDNLRIFLYGEEKYTLRIPEDSWGFRRG